MPKLKGKEALSLLTQVFKFLHAFLTAVEQESTLDPMRLLALLTDPIKMSLLVRYADSELVFDWVDLYTIGFKGLCCEVELEREDAEAWIACHHYELLDSSEAGCATAVRTFQKHLPALSFITKGKETGALDFWSRDGSPPVFMPSDQKIKPFTVFVVRTST